MLGSISHVMHSIAAYTNRRSDALPVIDTPSPTTREHSVNIRIIEQGSSSRLYLANGLMAGERAPGGAGGANRIRFGDTDIAVSGRPMFPVNTLPEISLPEERLIDRVTEGLTEARGETEPTPSFLSSWLASPFAPSTDSPPPTFGGDTERAIAAYQTQTAATDWRLEPTTAYSSLI